MPRHERTLRSPVPGLSRLVVAAMVLVCPSLAVGCSSATGGRDAIATDTTVLPTNGASCQPSRDGAPTNGPFTFTTTGGDRTGLLSLPADHDDTTPVPLIVDLHGHGSSGTRHESDSQLGARGADRGFVVLTPDALGSPSRWNFDRRTDGPDDYAFIDALVASYESELCIDPQRVYVVGSSNGAAFAGLLLCEGRRPFAAVAMVIATVIPGCLDVDPTPALTIRGTADTTVPYGASPNSALELVADLAARDGCPTPPRVDHPVDGVDRTAYGPCAGDAEVVLDTVVGGVHTWPGGTSADRPGNSTASVQFDATGQILDFFERNGRFDG
jgi:polyhydroxybutyrate depolymerase